ncbi:RNA-dependent RNA polymerase [Coleopteran arli-related virus OKIAV107]|uniref:RNA-directed RNA polymerase L n=1 Tax=Coleopteran arli-related virus OKIAV107 TaxID=2746353 RepID=A0AAE7LSQ3_9MONO|nr:RNA-dependent RNA polymerase [Coleopteran arli-related virus OKIAV107]QMP82314.1 RNA-dependent RNA polymerase [Coleopteran arli-related virus OKIAV107]
MSSEDININPTPDSHLQNPLRDCNRSLLSRGLQFIELNKIKLDKEFNNLSLLLKKFDKSIPVYIAELALKCPYENNRVNTDSEKIYGLLLSEVYNKEYPISNFIKRILPNVWRNVQRYLSIHKPFKDIKLSVEEAPLTEEILRLYSVKQNWELIRLRMQKKRINKDTSWSLIKHDCSNHFKTIYVSQHYAIIGNKDDFDQWMLDYDQVMMISDTLIGRVFSILYLEITPDSVKYKFDTSILTEIYKTWDRLFANYGNDTYKIVKAWEPIIQGLLLKNHDPLRISSDFLPSVVKDYDDILRPHITDQINYLSQLSLNEYQLSELHGIYRHWGHPTVDEAAGCSKVKNIAKNRSFPKIKMLKKAKGIFARHFCISFIQGHGRWPRVNLLKIRSKKGPLYKAIENNITNINFFSPRFSLHDWEEVEFMKEFEFDYHIDYLDVCEDKAISPYLNDLPTIYAKESLGWDPGKPTSSRRVLLELMRKTTVSPVDICKKIMNREVPDQWKIILVHSKEREIKIEPRLFAMFVLEMRIYYCITEANISNTIFRYFPQQTMTLSENELTKRLYSMANDDSTDLTLPVFMSIDFKSWNIHWQYATTYETFKHIDDLFGTPGLYTYSHIFFQEAIVALSSRFNPPKCIITSSRRRWKQNITDDDDLLWKNHLGGFEGIRQKGWTLVTILLLLIVELRTGIKSYIIGQGDNQFLKLMLPIDKRTRNLDKNAYIYSHQEKISNMLKDYMAILSTTASGFNLVIKTEESWFSSCIINYGKDILINGAYMSQGMKRISRIMPDINDLFPTMSKNITSLQTTGLATSQKSYDTWGPFFLCSVETILTIDREIRLSLMSGIKHNKRYREWIESDHGISFILHGDTNCTSVPILNPNSYIYRGHPDPLTAYLTVLTENYHNCTTCRNILVWLVRGKFKLGKGDPELLINDPLSLNIDSPTQVSQIFKNEIMKKVKGTVKNKELKEIFRYDSEKEDKSIYDFLITTEPFYPRLCHEIILQTVTGTREYIISKFSSARTTQQLLNTSELKTFFQKIIRSEEEMLKHWVHLSFQINIHGSGFDLKGPLCPTTIASNLRNITWREPLKGKIISGVTIPFPLHQFAISVATGLEHRDCTGETEYILYNMYSTINSDLTHTRGPYQPFYGHKTRERQSGKIYQIPQISRPLQASERLIQIYQWCLLNDDHMTAFVSSLIATRTNIPLDILELCTNTISSGSQFHRLNDHFTKRGVLMNTRPNTSSHIYVSTDNMGKYSRGSDNVNLHYQGALLVALTYIHYLTVYSINVPIKVLHQHYSCKQCEEYIPDTKVYSNTPPPRIKSYSENPLIYKRLEDVPTFLTPDSLTFKMVRSGSPSMALAHIIFSRILKNMHNTVWGTNQKNKVYSTKVSVRMIIDIGIDSILTDLALLIYLYFQSDFTHIIHILCTYQREIWQDLGPACLMPENLSILYYLTGKSYQPQLFESLTGVCRLLSRGLSLKIREVEKKGIKSHRKIVFYNIKGLSITKIFNMWSYFVYLISDKTVDLRALCKNISTEAGSISNIPSKTDLDTIDNTIKNHPNKQYALFSWNIAPLCLSKITAENSLGLRSIIKQHIPKVEKVGLGSMRSIKFLNTSFVHYIEIPLIEREMTMFSGLFLDDSVSNPPRNYMDHSYHLVHNLSSGYLKMIQILVSMKLEDVENPICLADGEGSVALLVYRLYQHPVIFNTIFNKSQSIAHRAINAIPAEFISDKEGVKLYDLSVLYGGDLTDPDFLNIFLNSLPDKSSLITFDAESGKGFTASQQYSMCKSVLKICIKTSCTLLIYKLYITSLYATRAVLSLINTVYESITLTVPVFSSNESYEVYAICTQFNSLTTLQAVGSHITQLGLALNQTLHNLMSERLTKYPHQYNNPIWKEITNIGTKLGFNNSLTHNFCRLSDYNVSLESCDDIVGAIQNVLSDIQDMIVKEWNGLYKISKGDILTPLEKATVGSSGSSHRMLDCFLSWKCNYLILSKILHIKSIRQILERTEELFCVDGSIYTSTGKCVYLYEYKYRYINSNYIRSIWVVWGHQNQV